ncbi:MAG: beta-lactamase family protein [Kineosporiaceae bacterium]|nr:beta-lactamase family protein [Kineosporiaceae bacterium]MBK8075518.1 beta-lactamase family protein [Kineosporiaceae bacterium]
MTFRRALLLGLTTLLIASLGIAACSDSTSGGTPTSGVAPSAGSAPLWAAPGTAALTATQGAALQSALDSWIAQDKLIGATAAVVTPQGVWSGATGVDGAGTRLQPEAAMAIMSVTKSFTAAEVMLLATRGLVNLDAPLTDYVQAPFDTKGATVRQALAMRTGFPDYATAPYVKTIAADLAKDWTPAQMLATLPKDSVRQGTLGGTPYYNSLNYVLLGELIAKVTGQSYAQALRVDLLDPAGLHRTWVQTAETPTGPLTVGKNTPAADTVDPAGPYLPSRSAASFTGAGGGMAGDAADLARWAYLLFGGQVIDSASVKQMVADPQEEPNVGPYALGTMVGDDEGTPTYGHAGGGRDWPYTSITLVWAGAQPVCVAVITPQPADFGSQIYELVMQLHTAASAN